MTHEYLLYIRAKTSDINCKIAVYGYSKAEYITLGTTMDWKFIYSETTFSYDDLIRIRIAQGTCLSGKGNDVIIDKILFVESDVDITEISDPLEWDTDYDGLNDKEERDLEWISIDADMDDDGINDTMDLEPKYDAWMRFEMWDILPYNRRSSSIDQLFECQIIAEITIKRYDTNSIIYDQDLRLPKESSNIRSNYYPISIPINDNKDIIYRITVSFKDEYGEQFDASPGPEKEFSIVYFPYIGVWGSPLSSDGWNSNDQDGFGFVSTYGENDKNDIDIQFSFDVSIGINPYPPPNDPYGLGPDNDGISTWTEIFVYHTSPNLEDTDSDGIGDKMEIMYNKEHMARETYLHKGVNPTINDGPISAGGTGLALEDVDGDGLNWIEENLAHIKYKGNPYKPDIFVEVDWMSGQSFSKSAKYLVMRPFARHNISLHIDDGWMGGGEEVFPHTDIIDDIDWNRYYSLNHEPIMWLGNDISSSIFHWCLIAEKYIDDETIGRGDYFNIQMAIFDTSNWVGGLIGEDRDVDQAKVFMHELGHNILGIYSPSEPDIHNNNLTWFEDKDNTLGNEHCPHKGQCVMYYEPLTSKHIDYCDDCWEAIDIGRAIN